MEEAAEEKELMKIVDASMKTINFSQESYTQIKE